MYHLCCCILRLINFGSFPYKHERPKSQYGVHMTSGRDKLTRDTGRYYLDIITIANKNIHSTGFLTLTYALLKIYRVHLFI